MERLRVDGRFLRLGSERVFLRLVTWGPFPAGWPADPAGELGRIRDAGFDAVRLYQWPDVAFLDAAAAAGLRVFAGLEWSQSVDFLRSGERNQAAVELSRVLARTPLHPALAGVFVANEVPADLVRWMGPVRVRRVLEELIRSGRRRRPELLWAYGNYPATEYLEPGNADLTAMNVYLEREADLRGYLKRLHHIAGDRPVLLSEFGLDSRRNGVGRQAETLAWAIRAAREEGLAGFAAYAWSDRWWNAGAEVTDWDFGLTDRDGRDKPALAAVREAFREELPAVEPPRFSVIVCTRNGRARLGACLGAIRRLRGVPFEGVVVDDGSDDGSADFVAREFPDFRLVRLDPCGLSAARNAGAEAATGEVLAFTDDDCEPDPDWLAELAPLFAAGYDAAGGPNLSPPPADLRQAVVASAPGAASHVMLDDTRAEHVPGCNLAVRRSVFFAIGGFDPVFHTAGDDVDFCWRLRDAGHRIGFAPNAFVWHHRRPSLRGYLGQQLGYGRAEALLMRKHPKRFSPSGDALWHGTIYSGAPVRATGAAVIYHGPMGMAGYQGVLPRMQPLRELAEGFDSGRARRLLGLLSWLSPRLRSWRRIRRFRGPVASRVPPATAPDGEWGVWSEQDREYYIRRMLAAGWRPGGGLDGWDLEREGTRVLLATERGDGPMKRTLIRVWGDPTVAPLPDLGNP